ncbi:hypothetical protein PSEHALCIP103_03114 [Pseudoalteromonas haloplanktis]|uniref:Lipoprotein n=1 Tax=Pseudoalteromonas haloplanktis TaxID=228 RepID=A0A9W4R2K4_PSEHA|nr:hypothetical protein PSEHALCIP103_03114 [Pseudoalteromonas haloplanktis]
MAFKRITLAFAMLLTGCEESLTVEGICVESPAMCNDLNQDSHCKAQREHTIFFVTLNLYNLPMSTNINYSKRLSTTINALLWQPTFST